MTNWTEATRQTGTNWTAIPKAVGPTTNVFSGGQPIGLLLALTQTTVTTTVGDPWTPITKASGTVWTAITR